MNRVHGEIEMSVDVDRRTARLRVAGLIETAFEELAKRWTPILKSGGVKPE